jgi:hypothetical protein
MVVMDAEGVTHPYFLKARSLRHAKRQAREWVARTEWAKTVVWVKPAVDGSSPRGLLAVAGLTFVVSGIAITAAMIIGLSLEGAL